MSIIFFSIVLLPALLFTLYNKSKNHAYVTYRELAVSLAGNVLIAILSITTLHMYVASTLSDTEIHNGELLAKQQDTVSCSHSYDCNCEDVCTENKDGTTSCREECDICYDHDNDYNWNIYTTVGNIEIPRIDRQGLDEPPRYTSAIIGEPVSVEKSYQNYFLSDPASLFLYSETAYEAYRDKVPSYPAVHDYYRINRVINLTKYPVAQFNEYLSEQLKTIGASKELNIVAVVTTFPEDFYYALMVHWKGGKKNDFILVYGIDEQTGTVTWFKSNTLAMGMRNQLVHTLLQSSTIGKQLDLELLAYQLSLINKHYIRLPASDFAYKKNDVDIPVWFILLVLAINAILSYYIGRYVKHN